MELESRDRIGPVETNTVGTVETILNRPVEILLRMSLKEGVVPKEARGANVVPIYKNGDREIALNLQTISIQP